MMLRVEAGKSGQLAVIRTNMFTHASDWDDWGSVVTTSVLWAEAGDLAWDRRRGLGLPRVQRVRP